jgi:hypothetical protein
MKIRTTVNAQNSTVETFSGLNHLGGTAIELELAPITLEPGRNTIVVEVLEPNGVPDVNPSNNIITIYTEVNGNEDQIPIRENFEGNFQEQWTTINPTGGMDWQEINLGSNTALYVNGYNNEYVGDKSWLVGPVLDFSNANEAGMIFNLSYAFRDRIIDRLQILVSTDCGISYADTIYNVTRTALARGQSSDGTWRPDTTQWQDLSFDLSKFAGQEQVRVAFVFTNGNGNNIYIDNIEFYLTKDPQSLPYNPFEPRFPFSVYPSPFSMSTDPALTVTFNLPEKQSVLIEMIDMNGRVIMRETPANVLNQSYEFFVPDVPTGTYLVRAITAEKVFTDKVTIVK